VKLFGSLPRHLYCYVERRFVAKTAGRPLEPCTWFGLTSVPGRAWGLTVLLESGALYSNVPPHAIVFGDQVAAAVNASNLQLALWTIGEAQAWDCFGYDFALHEYEHLAGRDVEAKIAGLEQLVDGAYLFTAQHYGDAYSLVPEQAKQFHFLQLENGRLAALPANRLVVHAPEFTRVDGLPTDLRRQTESYSCE
jgi:hypothetical protein